MTQAYKGITLEDLNINMTKVKKSEQIRYKDK